MFLEYALHADFLYRNSPYSINLSDECFLNYVATPRINTEDLTSCRKFFYEQVRERICKMDLKDAAIEINNWCYEHATYHSTSERTASPITVYKCGYGRCGEESTFYTTVLRSVGIPSRQVYVPRWSHSDSNHAWVEVFDGNKWLFTGACEPKPVFQNGWFSYATSRAMLVHSRCFTPFYVEKDEVIGNEGIVRISSSSSNYLKQKEIEFRVLDTDGEPVIGANVEFEIINSSELYPIIKTKTNKNGIATAKLGLGTVFARAYCMKKGSLFEKEMVFDVSTLENKNIVILGRLNDAIKGIIYAIKSMYYIVKEVPDAILYLVSSDGRIQFLKDLTKNLNLTQNIIFKPGSKNISAIFWNTSIHMFTSLSEAFPMAMNEGKAHGMPIVGFDVPYSVPYQQGFIGVDLFDIKGLARETIKLLKDYNYRKKMGEIAKKSLDVFKNNETVELWGKLCDSLLSEDREDYRQFQKYMEDKYYNEKKAREHLENQYNLLVKHNINLTCHTFENYLDMNYLRKIKACNFTKNVDNSKINTTNNNSLLL